ncbi:hypothetical protein Glove_168g239 [Diversispora epigaea]|uniref:Uncharacterized protein n=1 Tax=Diversispora epigaea TaxID=1348612 RepID=A0A397IUA8_9GLOM|nr:hypothetical protein Glove_168g239 [Diversispora epigaea]
MLISFIFSNCSVPINDPRVLLLGPNHTYTGVKECLRSFPYDHARVRKIIETLKSIQLNLKKGLNSMDFDFMTDI